ncbi:MAG: M42 family metallopeptidase [Armatimonadetes bacterium]|nr:M42 family metallopeptidase [Armatimonadota bacterium]
MRKESLAFFKELVNTPSPSGYETKAAEVYRTYTKPFADEIRTDVMGNVWAIINPKAKRQVMLAGHMDEIGFAVHYVSDEGLLYFSAIGGHDSAIPVGQRVWIHGPKGRVPGVIGRKAIHLLTQDERKQKPELDDLWIDIGVSSRDDAMGLIELGDVVTYQWEFQKMAGDVVTARGFDNKMGCFIVAEALRHLSEKKPNKDVGVIAVATVQEEIGLRGARTSAIGTQAEAGIAVDVTHAIDYPSVDKKKHGDMRMGKGPVVARGANINPVMFDLTKQAAKDEGIDIQIEVEPGGTGTDANAMQIAGAGMATGLLGVAIRYMHTPVEVLSLTDVEQCATLMAAVCRKITAKTDFTPR